MPELPDVEIFRRYTDEHALMKEIDSVDFSDDYILDDDPSDIENILTGSKLTKTRRIGKQMFIKTNADRWLHMHFGMTAHPKYLKENEEIPDFTQFKINYANGDHLAFVCPRKLAKIGLTDSVESYQATHKLGKDALDFSFDEFLDLMSGGKGKAKTTLMNQGSIAGIGNIYSDEILFQARVHPEMELVNLDQDTIRNMFNAMRRIFRVAINHDARPSELPKNYLVHYRDEGEECPNCKGKVEKIGISGRSGYFCPGCQKK